MSLLMDALKQAEEAKDEKDQEAAEPATDAGAPHSDDLQSETELSLELPDPVPIEDCLEEPGTDAAVEDHWVTDSELSNDSESAEEIAVPEDPHPPPDVSPAPAQDDTVTDKDETVDVSSVTAEKQEAATTPENTPPDAAAHVLSASRAYNRRHRTFLILTFTGLLSGVACAVTAYWYWAQSQSAQQYPVPFTSAVETDSVSNDVNEAMVSGTAETDITTNAADTSGTEPVEQDWQPAPVDPQALQARVDSPEASNDTLPSSETTLRFSRTRDRNSVQPALKSAYAAFRKNQFNKAKDLYRNILQREPRNRDALLGLAAVAVKNNDIDVAAGYYHRLLELNPKDSAAHAGLTMLLGSRDPVAAESQIKLLLNSQPDAAYLHFALGNVYSSQARWPEAQEAYFDAVRLDRENPDYVYNLAISLDRMSKHSAALRYYQTALSLGSTRTAGFKPNVIRERIHLLEAVNKNRAAGKP